MNSYIILTAHERAKIINEKGDSAEVIEPVEIVLQTKIARDYFEFVVVNSFVCPVNENLQSFSAVEGRLKI